MEEQKLWTKSFIAISVINFVVTLIFFLLMITIGTFAKDNYDASTSTAGFISSVFIIGSLIGRLGAGRLIGSQGTKKIFLIGLISFTVTSVLYFIEIGIPFLLLTRLLQGIAVGLVGTASGTAIAQIIPASRKGEGIGYYSLSSILATAIGPFAGIWLMKLDNGFSLIFALNFILSLLSIFLFIFIKLELPQVITKSSIQTKASFISKFIELKALPISIVALVIGFAYSGILTYITFYGEEINLVTATSYFFIVYAFVVVISRPFTGKLFDRRGANLILIPCFVLFAFGMFIFSQASAGWMILLSAILIGLGYGNFNSVAQSVAIKVTPKERFGLANSTYFIMFDLGLGIGPYILGKIIPYTGYRTIFVAMAILIVICIPLYYIVHGYKEKQLLFKQQS